MMKILLPLAATLTLLIPAAHAEDLLSGDKKLACEAILCLSSGDRPSECEPSIRKYLSIKHKKWGKTVNARRDFLKQCPDSDDEKSGMPSLINALAEGGGRCDAAFLNQQNRLCSRGDPGHRRCTVLPILPNFCKTYAAHDYTYKIEVPRYVCERTSRKMQNSGEWVSFCEQGKFVDN